MTTLRATLGDHVRRLRERHGLSQEQLGKACGTTKKTIISIEKAKAATNVDLLEELGRQLDVHPHQLLDPKFTGSSSHQSRREEPTPALTGSRRELFALLAPLDEAKV